MELSLEACLPVIESALRQVRRRYCLSRDEFDELRSEVHVHLLERKGLAAFQHRSTLRTYLVTTVQHALLDMRAKNWQKWRPSVTAKRLGALALRLEVLLFRDGHSFDEACHILRANHDVRESAAELAALKDQLPLRVRRQRVSEDAVESFAAAEGADTLLLESEQNLQATRLNAALEEALMGLPAEDRLIVKMRYYDGLKVSDIARLVGAEQKALYRRFERLHIRLRQVLVAAGHCEADVTAALVDARADWQGAFGRIVEWPKRADG